MYSELFTTYKDVPVETEEQAAYRRETGRPPIRIRRIQFENERCTMHAYVPVDVGCDILAHARPVRCDVEPARASMLAKDYAFPPTCIAAFHVFVVHADDANVLFSASGLHMHIAHRHARTWNKDQAYILSLHRADA
jgi:hypothetical protein